MPPAATTISADAAKPRVDVAAVLGDDDPSLVVGDAPRSAGAVLALDHVGAGASSLTTLHRLAPAVITIDEAVVGGTGADAQDRSLVAGLVALARAAGARIVAAGVDAPDHVRDLAALGCDAMMGDLVCAPLDAAGVVDWVLSR